MKTKTETESKPSLPPRAPAPIEAGMGSEAGTRTPRAFTLVELLVIVATLGLCALTIVPALARSKPGSQAAQCLNNNRQLCLAWRMYADDNHEFLVYSSDDGTVNANTGVAGDWQNNYAWTWSHLDFNPANFANWDPTVNITKRVLWPFLNNTNAEKCPADRSYVVVNGKTKPRVRTMLMNLYLGGFASANGTSGNDGGWGFADRYRIFQKMSDLDGTASLRPADTFVFLDEREDAIGWGNFLVNMTGYGGQANLYSFGGDLPGMYHNGACNFSFADGHAAPKRWVDPRTTPPLVSQQTFGSGASAASPGNPDVAWLQDHATRPY